MTTATATASGGLINRVTGNLSGGQKQKISIARALYRDTQIIIMDEPSSAMDPQSESDLCKLLENLKASKKTVIIAAHSRKIIETADCLIQVRNGKNVFDNLASFL